MYVCIYIYIYIYTYVGLGLGLAVLLVAPRLVAGLLHATKDYTPPPINVYSVYLK